jgi:hypothetical protein
VADLRDRLNYNWPKEGTALPPRHEIILTPLTATYKDSPHDVAVDITVDGNQVMWQAPPGAFEFVLADELQKLQNAPQ